MSAARDLGHAQTEPRIRDTVTVHRFVGLYIELQ